MITRRQPPVKQNPQSFLHCRKIAEKRRKTQKSCKFNLQIGCGFTPSVCSLWRSHTPPFVATRHLPPAGGSRPSRGRLNSLSQSLTALPAPSGREPLAWQEGLRLKCKAACRAYPFRPLPLIAATFPKGTASVVAGKSPVSPEAPSPRELARRKPRLREFSL